MSREPIVNIEDRIIRCCRQGNMSFDETAALLSLIINTHWTDKTVEQIGTIARDILQPAQERLQQR